MLKRIGFDERYRFLVIDEGELGDAMVRLFPDDEVVVAETATAASLRIAEAIDAQRPFDIILCSVVITMVGGASLVDIARSGTEWPVFAYVAAYFELEEVAAAPEADGTLIKPFTSKEVEDLVLRVLVDRDRVRTRQRMKLDN